MIKLDTRHLKLAYEKDEMPSGLPTRTWWKLNKKRAQTKTTWQIVYHYKDDEGKQHGGAFTIGTLDDFVNEREAQDTASFIMHSAMGIGVKDRAFMAWRNANSKSAKFTKEWYAENLILQGGKCAICDRTPTRLVVDHDHDTGDLRGLLCGNCNTGIGMLRDSAVLLRKATMYLEEHGQ